MRALPAIFTSFLVLQSACGREQPGSDTENAPTSASANLIPQPAAPTQNRPAPPPRDLLSDLTSSFGGDRAKAAAQLKTLNAISQASGYGLEHVSDWYMDLEPVRKRYSEKATLDVLSALLDIETRSGRKASEQVKYSIDNSARTDHWDAQATDVFAAAGVGSRAEFSAMIAVARKTTLANADLAILSDRVSSAEGINAFLQLVRKNLDGGGALGSLALNARTFTDAGTR